jgi:hypothetical protein
MMSFELDIRQFTHLGRDIEAVLDKQGAGATVKSVRTEVVKRVPKASVLVTALGAETGLDAMRKLDELIAMRMARRLSRREDQR